ncbi:helix-turn-helix protein [Motilibacter rhizosphaerae]|uniref:Helix-turn-helix protein n=1 Tax=Motilibacter rhizosphaerae TaxID=598652 RepID=A0A4V2F504_9ACTN|nr:helix-turn-helix domain-containing protein [Motilibacter rhizosphaerae]RZS91129.1 helix-turn-helix protein [Motilibacter rhizosphaerae]
MSAGAGLVLRMGGRVDWDGARWAVQGIDGASVILDDGHGTVRQVAVTRLTGDLLVDAPSAAADDQGHRPGSGSDDTGGEALGTVLAALPPEALEQVRERSRHVREVLTGYGSGSAEVPAPGEPRDAYLPARPRRDRMAEKARELGVSTKTIKRWVGAYLEGGPAGLADRRFGARSGPLARLDHRWLDAARAELDDLEEESTRWKDTVIRRIEVVLCRKYGVDGDGRCVVPLPSRATAHRALTALSQGRASFTTAKRRRSVANSPQGAYGKLRATRPGEYVLLDSTVLDVFAVDPVTHKWVRCECTVAIDLFSACILGLKLSPWSTRAVDASLVLYEVVVPNEGEYAGVPSFVVVDADQMETGRPLTHNEERRGVNQRLREMGGELPSVAPENVVIDHGKVYLSDLFLSACAAIGATVQPARPRTPTDKARVERFFRTVHEVLQNLPGFKGSDPLARGVDIESKAFYYLDELEAILREWIRDCYHARPHDGLALPERPGVPVSPRDMLNVGIARAGLLRLPASRTHIFNFLPTRWVHIKHYGIEFDGLRYNGPALTPYRDQASPYPAREGRWPVRRDPDDVRHAYFQDPADNTWHRLRWVHAPEVPAPFGEEVVAIAKALAREERRDVEPVLLRLIDDWTSGIVATRPQRIAAIRSAAARGDLKAAAVVAAPVSGDQTPEEYVYSAIALDPTPAAAVPRGAADAPPATGAPLADLDLPDEERRGPAPDQDDDIEPMEML